MKIAVLMGGRSGEHEVSLRSGAAVVKACDALGWESWPLVITRDGRATWPGVDGQSGSIAQGLVALEQARVDCAFIAMHGPDGEDGRVQGALELMGIPYQGSGVQASAIGLDKRRTKDLLRTAGLPVADDLVLGTRGGPTDWEQVTATLGLPVVLKTLASGSSVGVAIVRTQADLVKEGESMLATGLVVAERFVAGREFTLPVLESLDGQPNALPVVEIRPKSAAFFDYEAKYTPGATDEICPAPIEPNLEDRLRALGVAAHQALGCSGYSRTDCIVDPSGVVFLLEVNTLPGLTAESLLPKAAAAVGLTFAQLVERLVLRGIAAHGPGRPG
jgi:D-alanine-D-alanine ligase